MEDRGPDGRDGAPGAMDVRGVRDTIDHARRLLEKATTPEDLGALASEVRGRLRAALQALEESARAERAGLRAAAAHAQRSLPDELAEAERRIRENPLGAVLIAGGLGLVVGLLMRRR